MTSRLAASRSSADRLDVGRVVVVGREVAADRLDDRRRVLDPGLEDELVRPDRLVAERLLVRASASRRRTAGRARSPRARRARRARSPRPRTRARSSASSLISSFIFQRSSIESQLRSSTDDCSRPISPGSASPVDLLDRRVERRGRGELGEVEHPVDLPGAVVDVDRVLEQHREVEHRGGVGVELVEPGEIALELGTQAVAPPVEEVLGVVREDPAQVAADLARVLGVAAGRAACRAPRTPSPSTRIDGFAGTAAV